MDELKGTGRTVLAVVLLMINGVLNIIYGIAAISNSSFFTANSHFVFSSLKTWGWVALILGILQILASGSLGRGGQFGLWFAVLAAGLTAIAALLDIPAYPFWSLAVFVLSIWIIHGLLMFGETEERDSYRRAAPPAPPGV